LTAAIAKNDRDVVTVVVSNYEIPIVIAIEVAYRYRKRGARGRQVIPGRVEGSVASAE